MLRIGEFSQPSSTLSYFIGKDNTIAFQEIPSDLEKLTIKSTTEEIEFIPEVRKVKNETNLLLYDQINTSGHYNITLGVILSEDLVLTTTELNRILVFIPQKNYLNYLLNRQSEIKLT